jgi:phosphate starvation-inducible protein PhoH/intein/homing endonuclease
LRKKKNVNGRKEKIIDLTNVPLNVDNSRPSYRNRLKPRTENQKEYIRSIVENTITFCQGSAGSGKALTLQSKLFTKNGPITMGQVKIGDEIANPDGNFSKVLAVYPQGKKQVFRVHFSNNTYIDCCEEHLWSINQDGKKNKIVVNTKYILEYYRRHDRKRILSIECTKPVNFNRKQYIIDPYLMGIILSEGSLTNANLVFTTCEKEILTRISNTIDNKYCIKTKGEIDHRIVRKSKSFHTNLYKTELRSLGLWGKYAYEKHIPQEYKYGSVDQRIALLQGLMDGDGTVSKSGSVSYSTTSYLLAKDLSELVYSLGGTTRIKSKQGALKNDGCRHRVSYRLHIALPNDISVFFLDRKIKRIIPRTKYLPKLYVDRVEILGYEEMQCITVDHKDSLYLTDNYTPTHNTHCAVGLALEYLLDEKVKKIIITRPVVEAGEKIGYLPGKYEEKLFPYLLPIEDEVNYFIGQALNTTLKLHNKIEIVPLGFMRGRNFHDSFIVADECQNASYEQLKMLLTRIGQNSKMVLTGDVSQSDLARHLQGGFYEMITNLSNVEGIGISTLTDSDIVRNPIIAKILAKLDNYEQGRK